VGICSDIKQNWWDAVSRPTFYLPYTQAPTRTTYVLTRTARDPLHIVAPLRTAFQAIDPDQPIEEIHTLEKEISDAVATIRMICIVMALLCANALEVTAVGVVRTLPYTAAAKHAWDFTWYWDGIIKNYGAAVNGTSPTSDIGAKAGAAK